MIATLADLLIAAGAGSMAFLTACVAYGWLIKYFRTKDTPPENDES